MLRITVKPTLKEAKTIANVRLRHQSVVDSTACSGRQCIMHSDD